MMKYPLIFSLLLASLPLLAQIPEQDADTCWTAVKKPKDVCRRVVLYRPGDHSSKNYRIYRHCERRLTGDRSMVFYNFSVEWLLETMGK